MQLKAILLAASLVLCGVQFAEAQSLSPMRKTGVTPSDSKAFRLEVGNPYKTRMTFLVIPMDAKFETTVPDAKVSAPEVTLAPGRSRQVIVLFKINKKLKERTIGVCVQPKNLAGSILPRVCGTYTGRMLVAG